MAMTGGKKMLDYLAGILRRAETGKLVKVGFLEGATYPERPAAQVKKARAKKGKGPVKKKAPKGAPGGLGVATVAYIQEYGAPRAGIPARPYFRRMIAKNKGDWGWQLAEAMRQKGGDADAALTLMGHEIKAQLQQSIQELVQPPLAPATVARKGFDKPLIDTSHMLNSVDFEVVG